MRQKIDFLKMKKDSYYFTHDSNAHDDPKIMILLAEWGLEGYGIYWVLIEHLRNQKDYKAPLAILKPLALRFGSSEEKFRTIVTRYELFEVDRRQNFFSSSLIRRMLPLEEKREKMRQNALMRWNSDKKGDAIALPVHSKSNASKVKKSKVKKSINIPFDLFWDLYDKKVGDKSRCEKKWIKLKDTERQKIIDTLPDWKKRISEKQFQPYPETYLNQRRWNDEIEKKESIIFKSNI